VALVEVAVELTEVYFCCKPVEGLYMGTSSGSATLFKAMLLTGVPVK
jgi:hypothetical protein